MKDLKNTIIKLLISAFILIIAFVYLEKKPSSNSIQFEIQKKEDNTPPIPSKLQWYDPFKGVSNVQSKPKAIPKEEN